MSEKIEMIKCGNQNKDLQMCRECKRSGKSKDNEYESFPLVKTLMNGWDCSGYINVNQGSLF